MLQQLCLGRNSGTVEYIYFNTKMDAELVFHVRALCWAKTFPSTIAPVEKNQQQQIRCLLSSCPYLRDVRA